MARNTPAPPQFETVLEDHHRLRELLEEIRNLLAKRHYGAARIVCLADELAVDLRSHFDHEEQGGYLHEALAQAPQHADRAARLVAEHARFLEIAEAMRLSATEAAAADAWEVVTEQFQTFFQRFVEHETQENQLVQEALLNDIQAAD